MDRKPPDNHHDATADLLRAPLEAMCAGLETCRREAPLAYPALRKPGDKLSVTYRHLFEDLEELAYLIKLVRRSVLAAGAQAAAFDAACRRTGGFGPATPEGQLFNDRREHVQEVTVLLKVLHEWINHIYVTLAANQAFAQTVDKTVRARIARIVVTRDKLITHKGDLRDLVYGVSGFSNLATLRFNRTHFGVDEASIGEVAELFACVNRQIPELERDEANYHERLRILTEHHAVLTATVRKRMRGLVAKHGGESASVLSISELGAVLVNEMLIPLARKMFCPDTSGKDR